VGQRFALRYLDAAKGQQSFLAMDGAGASAVGTRVLGAEQLGLLLEQGGEGSFGQAGGSDSSDLLHGIQIDIGAGSGIAEGMAGNNFTPLGSEVTDFLESLGREFVLRHGLSCLVLTRIGGNAFLKSL
jgi:hypothetical protein